MGRTDAKSLSYTGQIPDGLHGKLSNGELAVVVEADLAIGDTGVVESALVKTFSCFGSLGWDKYSQSSTPHTVFELR